MTESYQRRDLVIRNLPLSLFPLLITLFASDSAELR